MNPSSSPDKMEVEELHCSSRESSRMICLQVLPSYLLAGLGMVTAGMLLDQVQAHLATFLSPLNEEQTAYTDEGWMADNIL
ncbi:hypothetical protein PAMP_017795 [Pampus punctatissimus]